jgi:hypothetical protein
MISALIVDDSLNQAQTQALLQLFSDVRTFADISVISTREQLDAAADARWITSDNLVNALAEGISSASSKRVLIVSSSLSFATGDISRIAAELESRSVLEHTVYEPSIGKSIIELPEMTSDSIIESVKVNSVWPLVCVATTRYALSATQPACCTSVAEYIAQTLIRSLSDGDVIRSSQISNPLMNPADAARLTELSNTQLSRCLHAAVDSLNIEELFPHHDWLSFSKESAAAAYHSLAALFIRFGDENAASQCLECSQRLEDSPRYFALKGIMQNANGETLGAVANFVSSLQMYEERKASTASHYITFTPSDLEVVQTRLAQGLNALNDKDNARAIEHFREAVFNFDPFFSQHGVERTRKNS